MTRSSRTGAPPASGSLQFLPGQVVGKAWAALLSVPLIRLLRRVAPALV